MPDSAASSHHAATDLPVTLPVIRMPSIRWADSSPGSPAGADPAASPLGAKALRLRHALSDEHCAASPTARATEKGLMVRVGRLFGAVKT